MSTQSLRELLESELAALSDCDENDLSDDDLDYGAVGICENYRNLVALRSDIDDGDDKLSSLDEWRLLMESSEQAERRLQNMEMSFNNCLVEEDERTIRNTPVDTCAGDLVHFPASHSVDDVTFGGGHQIEIDLISSTDYEQNDENIMVELLELMQCMIEAVERSAPIINAPALKPALTSIDWSQLPHVIGEEDVFTGNSNLTVNKELVTPYFDVISNSSGDVERAKQSTERQQQLKATEDNLLLDANSANQKATILKQRLLEKKQRMEVELGALKRDQSSVRISFRDVLSALRLLRTN